MADDGNRLLALEAGDEFEDFPVDDWTNTESEKTASEAGLWEEQWEDDDNLDDDFAETLKAELAEQAS